MPQRMNGGLAVAAIGAVLLIVSLFLDWFAPARSAWTVFELNDLILAGIALLVLEVAVADLLARPEAQRYVPEGSVVYAGMGALIIVGATLIQPPPGAIHSSREIGAWLGLAAAALITAGGFAIRARVSLVIALRAPEQLRRSAQTQDLAAYDPEVDDLQAYDPERDDPGAYEPEPDDPETYEPEAYESEEVPAEEYELEEPGVDPDTETRQFSEPPG